MVKNHRLHFIFLLTAPLFTALVDPTIAFSQQKDTLNVAETVQNFAPRISSPRAGYTALYTEAELTQLIQNFATSYTRAHPELDSKKCTLTAYAPREEAVRTNASTVRETYLNQDTANGTLSFALSIKSAADNNLKLIETGLSDQANDYETFKALLKSYFETADKNNKKISEFKVHRAYLVGSMSGNPRDLREYIHTTLRHPEVVVTVPEDDGTPHFGLVNQGTANEVALYCEIVNDRTVTTTVENITITLASVKISCPESEKEEVPVTSSSTTTSTRTSTSTTTNSTTTTNSSSTTKSTTPTTSSSTTPTSSSTTPAPSESTGDWTKTYPGYSGGYSVSGYGPKPKRYYPRLTKWLNKWESAKKKRHANRLRRQFRRGYCIRF